MTLNRRENQQAEETITDILTEPRKKTSIRFDKVISTGSTLLDLAISGGRTYYGGIPGGILVEIYGPAGSGKTAILSEMAAYAQGKKAKAEFMDPEGRLDAEYARIYDMAINKENYSRPDTVTDVFDYIWKRKTQASNYIDIIGIDSLAALSKIGRAHV